MAKRKQIPKAVYDRMIEITGYSRSNLKIRIYRGDLTIIEMARSEIEKHEQATKEHDKLVKKVKKKIYN